MCVCDMIKMPSAMIINIHGLWVWIAFTLEFTIRFIEVTAHRYQIRCDIIAPQIIYADETMIHFNFKKRKLRPLLNIKNYANG